MGGMIPGGSSEWRALYGTDKLAEKLFDMLENFCFYRPRNETTKEAWLSSVKNKFKVFKRLGWDDVVNTLKSVTDQAIGPGLDLSRPRPPRFPMITIVVTPSTHKNALNLGFTHYINFSRHRTPNTRYNGFILPEKDTQTDEQEYDAQVKNIVKNLKKKLNGELAPYKFVASEKEDSHDWYSVTCNSLHKSSNLEGGVDELRKFVNTFNTLAEDFVSKPGGNNTGSEDEDKHDGSEKNGEDDDDDDDDEGDYSGDEPDPDEGDVGQSMQQALPQQPARQGGTGFRLRVDNRYGHPCVTGIDQETAGKHMIRQGTLVE
ncbi:unnamed protein product [Rhizoctonia solani]|uniref:Uncharacterized protein n=1 Tax=Rhizoctonia solani TaxID=456999 RepID=A0A8H2XQ35_9AGAM|nr:unnamed protein product [Rhizoctonia solani]